MIFRTEPGWFTTLFINVGGIENNSLMFIFFIILFIFLPLSIPSSLINILWKKNK